MKKENAKSNKHIPPYGELDNETITKLLKVSLASFPPQWRTKKVARLLAETLKDQRTQRLLRGSPRRLLAMAGIEIPESVKIDVHETTHHSLHILLPHPMMIAGAEQETLSEAGEDDQVILTDEDLTTGGSTDITASNDWDSGDWFKDPATPDDKSDTKVGGLMGDLTNFFGSDNDADAATVADTGD